MRAQSATRTVLSLGIAQTLAWASTYYLPAILATPMAKELGIRSASVFAAFSVGLVLSAMLGPLAGRTIDRLGGRPVLACSNLVFAAGLAALGLCQGEVGLFAAWMLIGAGMAGGLYEAAFATLVRLHGMQSRRLITGITLIAGFASTVGWPMSTALEAWIGWRGTCFAWAGLHLLLALPLNLTLPNSAPPSVAQEPTVDAAPPLPSAPVPMTSAVLLALVFAVTWFISTAMAAHLPTLLAATGASLAVAVTAGALIGPAQVAARLLEFGVLQRIHPLLSAMLATTMHPVGALLLLAFGAPMALPFAVLHGAGNGILTIAKGTLPLVLFGPQGYGERQGLLMVPARLAQALAPWLFGLCVERWGSGALVVSAGTGALAVVALAVLWRTNMRPSIADRG